MQTVCRSAAALLSFFALSFVGSAGAQPVVPASSCPECAYLRGYWQVKVEGEDRLRELAIFAGAGRDGQQILAASYGWADAELAAVRAKASVDNEQTQLELTTPGSSTIKARTQDANTLVGTFRPNLFVSKSVTLTRVNDRSDRSGSAFAGEDKDFQVEPTTELTTDYHRNTPLTLPGAKTLKTMELWAWLNARTPPVIVDVLDGTVGKRTTLPTAVWGGSRFGRGDLADADRKDFTAMLSKLTMGDKAAPLVFLCLDASCWLSYNASLMALQDGYSNVFWYRGGWRAWAAARLPMVFAEQWAQRPSLR